MIQQLFDMTVSRPAVEEERLRFHSLWLAAQLDRDQRPKAVPPAKPSSVLMLQIRDAAGRTGPEMKHLRHRFQAVWSDVLGERRTLRSEDRGDGWAFWEGGTDLASQGYDKLLPALAERLHDGNEAAEPGLPLRLSGALHLAEVVTTETGLHGRGTNEAARLLDAPVVRSAVADVISEVAVAVSDQAWDAAGGREETNHCRAIFVSSFKEWAGGPVRLYTPRPWWPDWKR